MRISFVLFLKKNPTVKQVPFWDDCKMVKVQDYFTSPSLQPKVNVSSSVAQLCTYGRLGV